MATGARDHRHQDLRPPGGHRPLRHRARADPRLLRAQGRHLGQHPRRPGHRRQDRLRAAAALRRRSRRCSATSTRSRAPSARRTSPSTPTTRASPSSWPRSCATCRSTSTRRPRPRASPTARACARSSASSSCARRCARLEEALRRGRRRRARARAEVTVEAQVRAGSIGRRRGLRARRRSRVAVTAPESRRAQLVRRPTPAGASAWRRRRTCSSATATGPRSSSPRSATARWSRTTPRRCGVVPPGLTHDTVLAAYLLDPARRGYPFRRDLRGARARPPTSRTRRRPTPCVLQALAAWQREQLAERGLECAAGRGRAAAGGRAARHGARRRAARTASAWREVDERVRDEIHGLEREIWDLAGEEFVIGSPQQLGAVLFDKLGLSRKRRGKTGFSTDARVLQAIRDEHEIVPKIERWRELTSSLKTYLDVLPQLTDARVAPPHHVRAGRRHHRPPRLDQPQPAERPDPHRARARDPRLLRGRAGQRAHLGRLLAGRAAGPGPHRRRAGAQGDLRPRRGRAHGDRVAGLRQGRPSELDAAWTARSRR